MGIIGCAPGQQPKAEHFRPEGRAGRAGRELVGGLLAILTG